MQLTRKPVPVSGCTRIRRPAGVLVLALWLSLGCTQPKTNTDPRPQRLVLVVLDQFRPEYTANLKLPHLGELENRSAVFEKAHVGFLPATTVVAHQVIPRGRFPRNLAWTDDIHRDSAGTLGPKGRLYDPGELTHEQMKTLLVPHDAGHVANLLSGEFLAVGQKNYAVYALAGSQNGIFVTLSANLGKDPDTPAELIGWAHPVGIRVPASILSTPRSRFWVDSRPDFGTRDNVYRLGGHRTVVDPEDKHSGGDAWVMDVAMHLMERENWSVAMLTLGAIDRVGHMFGADRDLLHPNPSGIRMRDVIRQADFQVGRLVSFLQKKGWEKETVLIITADHGGLGATHWMGRNVPGGAWGNWAWGKLENTDTVPDIRPELAPLVEAGLEVIYSDTMLRCYMKTGSDLNRAVELLGELQGVTLVVKKNYGKTGFEFIPVLDNTRRLSPGERKWFNERIGPLLSTWNNENSPDLVAFLDEHTSWGQPGDHGGAQKAVQRIPLLISGPGIVPVRSQAPARLVDLAPTLWDLFGRSPGKIFDGQSLKSAFQKN